MNTDNVYLVILLVVGIVVLSNLLMFAWARSLRGSKFNWFKSTGEALSQPFKQSDDERNELRQRMEHLENNKKEDEG